MRDLSVVGKPIARVDARAKVTGEAVYAGDIILPRMLFGKILRSPHPHARIIGIDAAGASQLPGVEAVVTAKDLPEGRYGEFIFDQRPLASEKVVCIGEPIAAVEPGNL